MSIRALTFARECLRTDTTLHANARTILLLLADSCNHRTGMAFTGTWLAEQAGCDMRTVRRQIHQLRDRGHIRVAEQLGAASIVTFPTGAYLSTAPVTDVWGEHARAPVTGDRPPLSPVTAIPGSVPGVINSPNNLEVVAREALCCDGTGWIYNSDTNDVSRCPFHHPRREAVS